MKEPFDVIRRGAITPFELAFGVLSAYAGVSGLFEFTPQTSAFNTALPEWLRTLTNLLYAISGIAICGGILYKFREVEAFGLTLLVASLLARVIVLLSIFGASVIVLGTVITTVCMMSAVFVRLWVLISGRVVVLVELTDDSAEVGGAV